MRGGIERAVDGGISVLPSDPAGAEEKRVEEAPASDGKAEPKGT